MNTNELYHYGVKGMRWGIRRNRKKDNINTANKNRKKIIYSRKDMEIDRILYGDRGVNRIKKRMNNGSSHRKAVIMETMREIGVNTVVPSVVTLASLDHMTNGSIHKYMFKTFSEAARKYANNRAKQKANAGLARIGTYSYRKVAKDVYESVMR